MAAMANATALELVCTKETCPIDESYFEYLPSLSLNALLLALFSLSLLVSVGQGAWYRTWTFTFAMVCGNICMPPSPSFRAALDGWDGRADIPVFFCRRGLGIHGPSDGKQ